jgi:hypothetical protein
LSRSVRIALVTVAATGDVRPFVLGLALRVAAR